MIPFILGDRCEVGSARGKSLLVWGQCQIKSNQRSNKVKGCGKQAFCLAAAPARALGGIVLACQVALVLFDAERMAEDGNWSGEGRFSFPASLGQLKMLCCVMLTWTLQLTSLRKTPAWNETLRLSVLYFQHGVSIINFSVALHFDDRGRKHNINISLSFLEENDKFL